tara:strand:+ start:1455 stop:2408 length:954 start_codon:yes stop_codon:yes gene_type:complete
MTDIDKCRQAGKIHKQIRNEIQQWIKPGLNVIDISNKIENRIKELTNYDVNNPQNGGIAFPTGLSINNCAAHWTPNSGDKYILKELDLCKIDYGVHIEGMIVDSAFTISFDSKYDKLLEASESSTDIGIKMSGPDAHIGDISANIQENLESFEIEIDGTTHPIVSVKELMGHQIEPFKIHSHKRVPNYKLEYNERMLEGEYYAIETFASTGKGSAREGHECSHYMLNYNVDYKNIPLSKKEQKFLVQIENQFGTLAFCNRWLDTLKINRYDHFLKNLTKANVINKYPPLYDINGSFVSQFEHTIHINSHGSEIISLL